MTRHRLVYSFLLASAGVSLGGRAWAQLSSEQGLNNTGRDSAWAQMGTVTTRAPVGQETGFKVGPTTLLHVGVGAEGGFDSNVFFSKASDPNLVSSPLLRVTPFVEITNATRAGTVPAGAYYDLSAALQYREYLSDNDKARAQRAFNPSVSGVLDISTGQTFALGLADTFTRFEEAPYVQSTQHISRDHNQGSLDLRFAPGGGRLRGLVRYTNTVDYFERDSGYSFASNMGNEVMLDGSWLWLPKTAVFVQVAQGYVHYIGDKSPNSPKYDSYPLRALAGLRGLLTEKLSVQLGAGYANAFYQGGTNTSGLSNLSAFVELTHRPTLLTHLTLGYRHEYRNSVIGSYYDVDSVYLGVGQRIATHLNVLAHGKYEFRRYRGSATFTDGSTLPLARNDNYIEAGISADYYVQDWIYAGVGYMLLVDNSHFDNKDPRLVATGIDFVKHQISFRLGVVF